MTLEITRRPDGTPTLVISCDNDKQVQDIAAHIGISGSMEIFNKRLRDLLPGSGKLGYAAPKKCLLIGGMTVDKAADAFIMRTLMGNCTREEASILPAVLDFVAQSKSGGARR